MGGLPFGGWAPRKRGAGPEGPGRLPPRDFPNVGRPCVPPMTRRRRTLVAMIRWLLVIFLALLLFNGLHAWLERIGRGRLPGDFRFRLFGRVTCLPIVSTDLLLVMS